MSADPRRERIHELLADRALVGLNAAEEGELAQLLAETGTSAGIELELAAAALDSTLGARPTEMPASLRARLAASARAFEPATRPLPVEARPKSTFEPRPVAPRGNVLALSGWLVAAAALLVAFLAWRTRAPGAPAPAELRGELLARADTLHLDWTATEQGAGASGDVVWSQATQTGVLRITGLSANDPSREQLQLWIFDEAQKNPIDGGVFDVTGGEVLIPIDAKLRVQKPTLFAVTREQPGGVVVSDQQRIVLVAKL